MVIGVWGERESNSDYRFLQLHGERVLTGISETNTDKYMEKKEKEVQTKRVAL